MTISIITLFPEMLEGPFNHSIIKKAINKNLVKINYINIRDFGIGKHRIVDDKPYGGGKGMILRVDVVHKAIEKARSFKEKDKEKVILLDPAGKRYDQKTAKRLSDLKHLILVCGHYEGLDARVKKFSDEEISIGDFILTGGEIPAIVITDSVVRLIKGVLAENVIDEESFSEKEQGEAILEYPQYTRPKAFKNLKVPKILLSGDHQKIKKWKKENARKMTKLKRPDLLKFKKVN